MRRFIKDKLNPLEDEVEDRGALDPVKARAIHAQSRSLGLYALNMPAGLGALKGRTPQ